MQPVSDNSVCGQILREANSTILINEDAISQFVFCCDHAGAEIPHRLGNLGISEDDLNDHIGIDIGIFATTCWIAGSLKAPLVAQPISRLVIDCNRHPESSDSIRQVYDGRTIPGNMGIDEAERKRRRKDILEPYQGTVSKVLAFAGKALKKPPILMAMHSFSRTYAGKRRECDVGVIFEGRQKFANAFLANLTAACDLKVRYNEPYRIDFPGDYTISANAGVNGLAYVEIEICQDMIADCRGQRKIARLISAVMTATQFQLDEAD